MRLLYPILGIDDFAEAARDLAADARGMPPQKPGARRCRDAARASRIREAGQVREVLSGARDDGGEPVTVHVLMQAGDVAMTSRFDSVRV